MQVDAGPASSEDQQRVLAVLREVDDEFVPPLSARADTVSLPLSGSAAPLRAGSEVGVEAYFTAMQHESWLLARVSAAVVGVLSYVPGHVEPALAGHSPSHHVTTIAVARRCRGAGVATALYDALDAEARRASVLWVSTRTWSTNRGHLRLLGARRFHEVVRSPRGWGVDSVYLARHVPPGQPPRGDVTALRSGPCPRTG